MGINNLSALWQSACTAVINGEVCGKEECSAVHMTSDGHDFQN